MSGKGPAVSHKKKPPPTSSSSAHQQVLSKYFSLAPSSAPSASSSSSSSTAASAPPSAPPPPPPLPAGGRSRPTPARRKGKEAVAPVAVSDDNVEDAEVDELMGVERADGSSNVFSAFAFDRAEGGRSGRGKDEVKVTAEGGRGSDGGRSSGERQGSARKRRKLSDVVDVVEDEEDEDDDKENQRRADAVEVEVQAEEVEVQDEERKEGEAADESEAMATDGDEDLPLSSLPSLNARLRPQPSQTRPSKAPPVVTFPSHFVSDPSIHHRNVRRFLEREALNDGAEADSTDSLNPPATSSASSPLDLTDDSISPSLPPPPPRAAKVKYTPLEQQVVDIKRRHPDLLLFFEVGYKYRFFGADAEVAAKHLDIIAHPSPTASQLLTASIPTFRLLVHLRRLVEAGYKVGVVRQVESAAQKKLNKDSGGFARKLTEVYTKATMVNEVVMGDGSDGVGEGENASRFIMVLYEEPGVGNWTAPTPTSPFFDCGPVVVHLLAFDPITGAVVYDSFTDGFMRNELETRLIQLGPVELLLPESGRWLSRNTWKLIQGWQEGREVVRVERMDGKKYFFDYSKGTAVVTDYYSKAASASSSSSSAPSSASSPAAASASLDFALSLPKGPLICLSVLIPYLQAFHLSAAFLLSNNFRPFLNTRYVLLNNSTLINLEVLSSSSSDQKRGSLLWLCQHTKTSFGTRLLRHWVSHPLLSIGAINERLDAVTELMDSSNDFPQNLATLLASLPDLERGLSRIHYSTCKPKEFLLLLQAYQQILSTLPPASAVHSTGLRRLLQSIEREQTEEVLSFFLRSLNEAAIAVEEKQQDKSQFYTDPTLFPVIAERKSAIRQQEQHMQALLVSIRAQLGVGYGGLQWKSVLTNEYLIEVDNNATDLKKVPRSWIKVNSTKAKVRYHTPEVIDGWMQLTRARELLEEEAERSWRAFLRRFSDSYALFRHIINALSELDCLLSLATTSLTAGYARPTFTADKRTLEMDDFRHPMTEQLISGAYVPNSVHLEEAGEELLIITGPNMGGKSSSIRAIALTIVMAQLGCYVAASRCHLSVFDGIHTRMGARDSLHTGKSTFLVELAETQQMLAAATPRSLLVFDELGRGTSTDDGVAIAYSVMQWVLQHIKAFTLLVTHYPQLARLTQTFPHTVGVYHMSFMSEQRRPQLTEGEEEEENKCEAIVMDGDGETGAASTASASADDDADVVFMYSLVRGVAPRSFGLNVARLAHVNEEVVQRAAEIARIMRGEEKREEAADSGPADRQQLEDVQRQLEGLLVDVEEID